MTVLGIAALFLAGVFGTYYLFAAAIERLRRPNLSQQIAAWMLIALVGVAWWVFAGFVAAS